MQLSLTFIRLLFLALCALLSTTYSISWSAQSAPLAIAIGILCGLVFGGAVISFDTFFKRVNLRAFNIATVGLFFGYLMGEAVMLVFQTVMDASNIQIQPTALAAMRSAIFLIACYLGMVMTARAADELYMSIPFIKLKPSSQKKKDLVIDASALSDPRLLDLAATGLLDQLMIVPRFLVKELQEQAESSDEGIRSKARRSLDTLKKLEDTPSLDIRYNDTCINEIKDSSAKLNRLARLLDANILTADCARAQQFIVDGIRQINLNALSNALKPLAQTGEMLIIKIQRYGKEARQGVGYLDDGTMVVVNGGAEFIGETIRAQVLSVKHTSSGRMIFCNAVEEGSCGDPLLASSSTSGIETSAANYFAH